jgi:hypothetical protein
MKLKFLYVRLEVKTGSGTAPPAKMEPLETFSALTGAVRDRLAELYAATLYNLLHVVVQNTVTPNWIVRPVILSRLLHDVKQLFR